jgi:hypothetical protein
VSPYQSDSLAEGTYSIRIEMLGFKICTVNDVVIEGNTTTNIDVVLEVRALTGELIIVEPSI